MECNTENTSAVEGAQSFEVDYFQDMECALSPPSAYCKTPERIGGIEVEIARRKPPFKPFYPPRFLYMSKQPKPKGWPFKTEEEPPPVPKCTPRFFLKRIYQTLSRNQGLSTSETISDAWSYWNSYEMEAPDVFCYNSIDVAGNLILLLSIGCSHFASLQELFDKIMTRLQRGIYLGDATKELNDSKKMTLFFSCMGVAIMEGHVHAQTCIANILGVWLENAINKRKLGVKKSRCALSTKLMKNSKVLSLRVPDYVLIGTLEKSLLPTTIAKNIKSDMHIDAYGAILSLLKLCCEASPKIRSRLWCLPIVDKVLNNLALPDPSNRILLKSIDYLYSHYGVYTLYQEDKLTPQIIPRLSRDSFQILVERFLQQVETPPSPSKSLLGIRNDTAFLICLIGKRVPFSGEYYRHHGLTIATMVMKIIHGESGPDEDFILESTPEDLELLHLMIFMLKTIIEAGRGEKIVRKCSLVSVLLTMVVGPCGLPEEGDEDMISKAKDLHNVAWRTVQAIAKEFPYCLVMQGGAGVLLASLKLFGLTEEKGNPEILGMTLHTLRILLSTTPPPLEERDLDDEDVQVYIMNYFVENRAMAIFLSVLSRVTRSDDFGQFQEIITSNALYCCLTLGVWDHGMKQMFLKYDGVGLMTLILNILAKIPAEKRNLDPVNQIAVSECICTFIAYNPSALERFLELEGILRLLDVLEVASSPEAILHLTNCIVQLCDYPRCLQQLLCWKRPAKNIVQKYVFGDAVDTAAKALLFSASEVPKTGDNLLELEKGNEEFGLGAFICSLWRDDEKRNDVLRDPDGCIASLSQPLMTKKAREVAPTKVEYDDDGETESLSTIHRATIDMNNSSLRPKIYLLIKRILDSSNTIVTLYDGLSVVNQILLQVIINFMDLKKAEVYTDLADEMQKQGYTFAPSDDEQATTMVAIASNTVAAILESQRYILRTIKEKECVKETEFYSIVKQCRLQDHLLAAREADYYARTTNYQYLVERRLWQKRELDEASRCVDMSSLKNSRVHRTSDSYINVTRWTGPMKCVESEPKFRDDIFFGDFEDNDYVDEDEKVKEDTESQSPLQTPEMLTGSIMELPGLESSTVMCSETCTPVEPSEGGYYQVSPYLLRQALGKVVVFREKNNEWIQIMEEDEENQWKTGRKWKQEWYPLDRLRNKEKDEEMDPRDYSFKNIKMKYDKKIMNNFA